MMDIMVITIDHNAKGNGVVMHFLKMIDLIAMKMMILIMIIVVSVINDTNVNVMKCMTCVRICNVSFGI